MRAGVHGPAFSRGHADFLRRLCSWWRGWDPAASGPIAGGTTVNVSGSCFQSGITATLGGKSASVTFKDVNTLTIVTPALSTGPQQIVLSNPWGETVSLDAAFLAQ